MNKILLRFDDICPTMNWDLWGVAKKELERYNVTALLGVIPDCKDPDLLIDEPRADFWNYIVELQKQGFTIAMHGYRHVFECDHSEFAGLPYENQLEKIRNGKYILNTHGIFTDVFFAPAHNYDRNTIRALSECGFKYLSDGLSSKPYFIDGIKLLPCRFGGIPGEKQIYGHVTAVVHAHEWGRPDKSIEKEKFKSLLANHYSEVVSFDDFCGWTSGTVIIQVISGFLYSMFSKYLVPFLSRIKHTFLS